MFDNHNPGAKPRLTGFVNLNPLLHGAGCRIATPSTSTFYFPVCHENH